MDASRDPTAGAEPARRRSDRLQAAVKKACVLLFLVGCVAAVFVGVRAYETQRAREQADALYGYSVTGRVETSAASANAVTRVPRWKAEVSWTDRHGNRLRQQMALPGLVAAQRTVRLWVDAGGHASLAPPTTGYGLVTAVGAGLATALVLATALAGMYAMVAAVLEEKRLDQWQREWAEVEPGWRQELL